MRTGTVATAIVLSVLGAGFSWGGEVDRDGQRREMMELMRKRKEGVELTEAEMQRARQLREQMGGAGGREGREGRGKGGAREGRERGGEGRRGERGFGPGAPKAKAASTSRFNVLDQAAFAVADVLLKAKRHKDAAGELLHLAEHSPDADARSLAHFKLGDIYGNALADPGKSKLHYRKVGGLLSEQAQMAVIGPLLAAGKAKEAATELERFIKDAPDAVAKSIAIRRMVELAVRSGNLDEMVATLEKARKLLGYGEAQKASKELAELRERAEVDGGEGGRRMEGPPGWAKDKGRGREKIGMGGGAGPEVIERIKQQVKKFEDAGQPERAAKLKKMLERLEAKKGAGDGRPAPNDAPAPPGGGGGDGEIF